MTAPIEMLFGLMIRVGPRNDVLDGAEIPMEGAIIKEKGAAR